MTAKELRRRRRRREISLTALARRIGVEAWTLCRWEKEQRKPTDAEMRTWARELAKAEKEKMAS